MSAIYNFTTLDGVGRDGPTSSAGYNGNPIVTLSSGIQIWTVPVGGTYEIIAAGAQGGGTSTYETEGIIIKQVVFFAAGEEIYILVGQEGLQNGTRAVWQYSAGGGGATFVVKKITGTILSDTSELSIILIAGGGGAWRDINMNATSAANAQECSRANFTLNGKHGRYAPTSGAGAASGSNGGSNGDGGSATITSSWRGSSGAGFIGDAPPSTDTRSTASGGVGAKSFRNGGIGAQNTAYDSEKAEGGFGGGGGGGWGGSGGGGGYSGGGAANSNSAAAGGGGGSYYQIPPDTASDEGYNTGHGHVKITFLSPSTTPINGSNVSLSHIKEKYIEHGTTDAEGHAKLYAIYGFQSHTFTNCNASGALGPTLTDCRSEYGSSSNWWNTDYFNVSGSATSNGIQVWTVPHTGSYQIEAYGASGGDAQNTYLGGKGAVMGGTFTLTSGDKYMILIGQMGFSGAATSLGSSGGGGTFFVKGEDYTNNFTLLIAAGGGGGAPRVNSQSVNGTNGEIVATNTNTDGGSAGIYGNGGGGGLVLNGAGNGYSPQSDTYGYAFMNGGAGGEGGWYSSARGASGGFGGGGGASVHAGGGGGGCKGGDAGAGSQTAWNGKGGGSNISLYGSNQSSDVRAVSGHGYLTITALDSPGIKLSYFDGATFTDHTSVYRPLSMSEFKNKTFGFANIITPDKWRFYSRYSNNSTYLMGDLPGVNGKPNTSASLSQPQASTPDYFTMFISYNNSSGVSPGIIVDRLSPKCIDEATIWMKVVSWNNYIPTMLGLIKKDYDKATWDDQIGINAMDTISGSFGDRFCFVTRGYHTYAGSRDDIVASNASFTDESVGPYNGSLTSFFHNRYGVTQGTQLTSSCQSVSNNITASPSSGWATRFLDTTSTNLPGYPGFTSATTLPYIGLKIKWYETTIQASLQNNWHVILNPNGSGTSWTNASLTDVFSGMYVSGTGIPENTLIGDIYSNYMIMYQEQNTESVSTKLPVQNATSTEIDVTLTINGYLYWTLTTDPHTAYENPKYIGPPHTVLPRYQLTSGGAYHPTTEWAFYIGDTTSGTTNDFKYDIVATEPKSSAGERFSYGPITYNASTSPDQPVPQNHEFALNPYDTSPLMYIIQGALSNETPTISGISLRNPPFWVGVGWQNYSMGAMYKFTAAGNIVALGVMNYYESQLGLYYNGTTDTNLGNTAGNAARKAKCTVTGTHTANVYRYMTLSNPWPVTAGQYYWVMVKNYSGGYAGQHSYYPPFPTPATASATNATGNVILWKMGYASSGVGSNTATDQYLKMDYPQYHFTNVFYGNTDLIFVPS